MNNKTIAVVNASGRQAASLIRVASAVGYNVRAQIQSHDGIIALELANLPNVTLFEGSLTDGELVKTIFKGARLAFVNTVSFGDEAAIGKALANAAKKANVQHYIYSSMPDHNVFEKDWPSLPHWSVKFLVENYIRQIELPATFVYTGVYNNNFTSLPYPLFCLEEVDGGREGLVWKAPFHPDIKLPWLDAEHDVGPAILQIFKDGPRKWGGSRIALAFELLTPNEVAAAFSRALKRPVSYIRGPIEIKVPIPSGYREQLQALQILFGEHDAPYFGLGLGGKRGLAEARSLWEGWRGIEEYAGEAFIIEERANGKTWMDERDEKDAIEEENDEGDVDGDLDEDGDEGEGEPAMEMMNARFA
ncbi:hypothetical protein MMC25_007722 [Agyrium rufum]|nr:hypothetical protein [Agyrium rufum]